MTNQLQYVRFATRVVCLSPSGTVEEEGTYEELMAAGGAFAELYSTHLGNDGSETSDGSGGVQDNGDKVVDDAGGDAGDPAKAGGDGTGVLPFLTARFFFVCEKGGRGWVLW